MVAIRNGQANLFDEALGLGRQLKGSRVPHAAEYDELVPADTGNEITGLRRLPQHASHMNEYRIPAACCASLICLKRSRSMCISAMRRLPSGSLVQAASTASR